MIHGLISHAYLPILLEWEEAQPKNLHVVHLKLQFTALLSQSGINFGHLRLVQLHQNLPQFFAETMSPTVFLIFWIISPKPRRRCIWIISSKPRRRFIFDDDLGHGNHSGELLLFVGCIVNFVVSYLICMFQDSVPAGSYNDPFLSSVWAT